MGGYRIDHWKGSIEILSFGISVFFLMFKIAVCRGLNMTYESETRLIAR